MHLYILSSHSGCLENYKLHGKSGMLDNLLRIIPAIYMNLTDISYSWDEDVSIFLSPEGEQVLSHWVGCSVPIHHAAMSTCSSRLIQPNAKNILHPPLESSFPCLYLVLSSKLHPSQIWYKRDNTLPFLTVRCVFLEVFLYVLSSFIKLYTSTMCS